MKTVLAARASAILYNLLLSRADGRPFLLPANVCPVVPLTFLKAKVPFEFVDITSEDLHMDLEACQRLLSANEGSYGGLLYVHSYGDPSTPKECFAEIKEANPDLLLIDDRCLCVPDLEPDGSPAADVVLYSTGYAKIVDLGIGGYAFLDEKTIYDEREPPPFRPPAWEQIEQDYKLCLETGSPYKYVDSDWLQTEADLSSWSRYSERVRNNLKISLIQRRHINAVYDELIPEERRLPPDYQQWRYNVRVKDSKRTLSAIFSGGLFASSHYQSLPGIFGPGTGPKADELAHHVVNLFNDHHYSPEMAEKTARLVLGSL